MLPIDLFVRAPLGMLRDKCVLAANNLALEVCGETRMVFRQSCGVLVARQSRLDRSPRTFDAQISAQK